MTIKRPLVWISAALVGGAAFASAFGPPFLPFAIAFLALFILSAILLVFKKRAPAGVAVVAASFLLGTCVYLLEAHVRGIPDQLARHYATDTSTPAVLRGTVGERRLTRDTRRVTFMLDVERIETDVGGAPVSTEVHGRTRVSWYSPSASVEVGDVVEVAGKMKLLKGFKNPGGFDYERYMHRRGIFTNMYATGPDAVTIEGRGELGLARRFTEYFRREGLEIIGSATRTEETRAFMSAILLGERGLLTEEMEGWFKRTGTFHVLAISGLHIGLVYLIVSLALSPLPLGTKGRVAVAIAIVWLYALATGGRVSVTRASIMLTVVLAGYHLGREGDFLTSVAMAALIVVGLDPVIVDDLGFQLSFSAILLLCTFEPFYTRTLYPALQAKLSRLPAPVLNRLAITLFASLVIGVGMLPLQAYHFNMLSFVFPIANLVVIPLLSFVLAAGFACLLTGFVWLKAATVFGLVAEAFSWMIFGMVKLCSFAPGSAVRVASPPLWVLGIEGLAITLIWWRPLSARRLAPFAAVAALLVATSFSTRTPGGTLRATFLEVGDADSCLIEFPSGETMLIDTGFASKGLDCGEDLIAPLLWKKGITEIDTLVLTHPDADHTGGALFLIENFRIGRLWAPDTGNTPPGFEEVFRALDERGIPIERLNADSLLADVGGAHIEALGPPPDAARYNLSNNDLTLALRVTFEETGLFFAGDCGKEAFRFMIDSKRDLESEILKASHHGFRSGFDREFVELVHPRLVVLSAGTHRFNQTLKERKGRYAPFCETVLCTKDGGAVSVETDGHDLEVEVTRRPRAALF